MLSARTPRCSRIARSPSHTLAVDGTTVRSFLLIEVGPVGGRLPCRMPQHDQGAHGGPVDPMDFRESESDRSVRPSPDDPRWRCGTPYGRERGDRLPLLMRSLRIRAARFRFRSLAFVPLAQGAAPAENTRGPDCGLLRVVLAHDPWIARLFCGGAILEQPRGGVGGRTGGGRGGGGVLMGGGGGGVLPLPQDLCERKSWLRLNSCPRFAIG